jgi:A/G-specific adenine glycosylase
MPWRETEDPYAIWVSEIMLQQTRVETVIPYFRAWMEAFPSPTALADAHQSDVLKRWEGLGYYSRARNLHRAAQVVREEHGGRLPGTVEGLRSLPGVGPYTAGAVGSIAFGLQTPAVDGNVRRVTARLLDWPDPGGRPLEDEVGRWVPSARPGDFNQALMELGATVCTPRNPGCYICPVAELCAARAAGTVGERPVPKKKAKVRREVHAVVVRLRREVCGGPDGDGSGGPGVGGSWKLALRQRPPHGLLAGLWEFPASVVAGTEEARRYSEEGAGSGRVLHLDPVPHAFSHLHVTYVPSVVLEADRGADRGLEPGLEWLTPEQVRGLALPVAQQKILAAVLRDVENHGSP